MHLQEPLLEDEHGHEEYAQRTATDGHVDRGGENVARDANGVRELVKESLWLIGVQGYDRLDGQHSLLCHLGLSFRSLSNFVRQRSFVFVFMLVFVFTPMGVIELITFVRELTPIYCPAEACAPIQDAMFLDCDVRDYMRDVLLFVSPTSQVHCWYYMANSTTTCEDSCPNNDKLLDCGTIRADVASVTNHTFTSMTTTPSSTISTNTTVMLGCFYSCTEDTCLSLVMPHTATIFGVMEMFFWFFFVLTLLIMGYNQQYFPPHPRRLIKKLTADFPIGTFMVSYSWGAGSGEQGSSTLVSDVARLLPCCWWDREQLLPGSDVETVCLEACENCIRGFVFISHNYLRSPICRKELATLRCVRGKVIALMHSDVYSTEQGQELRRQLLCEGHTVDILYPSTHTGFNVGTILLRLLKRVKNSALRYLFPNDFTIASDTEVFGVTEAVLPYDKYIFAVLCGRGLFCEMFSLQSPPLNEHWRCAASVLGSRIRWRRYIRLIFAMSAYFFVDVLVILDVWAKQFDTPVFRAVYISVTVINLVWLVLFLTELHISSSKKSIPKAAHLLLMLHRLGVLLPKSVEDICNTEPPIKTTDDTAATTNDVKTSASFAPIKLPTFRRKKCDWPLRTSLVPPPIAIDVGAEPRLVNITKIAEVKNEQKVMRYLHDEGVLTVHSGDVALADVELQYVQIFPDTQLTTADPDKQIFWTTCSFMELSLTTRNTLANCVVAVDTIAPSSEEIIIQLFLRKFKLCGKDLRVGSGKWKNKNLRKYLRN
eukprot:m.165611 g.165611  ORF g.165611 m.165611 type:complete len:768 (-) comp31390_c1_seq2:230-2533(-)